MSFLEQMKANKGPERGGNYLLSQVRAKCKKINHGIF
jgi:hypothetical protein